MKQFHYKAYDEEGGIHEGSLAARTKREAAAALFSEGLSVIRLFEEKEAHQFSVRGLLQAAVRCPFWLRPGQHFFPQG